MLIVISNPAFFHGEARLINGLFGEGMEIIHLRKPGCTPKEMEDLLREIAPENYPKIALHQAHELAPAFGIQRLQFTEMNRKETDESFFHLKQNEGFTLSTSVHHFEDYAKLPNAFSYVFLGPVFESISKPGYSPAPESKVIPDREGERPALIAIGGIHSGNCTQPFAMGYDGVAVLGAVWQQGDAISSFKKIKAACATAVL
jgi:thiamine-phosphate pyrophosphorylase